MRAWILLGALVTAAAGAAACGTQAASPLGSTDAANLAAGSTMVRCEPGQHAVVNTSSVSGRAVTAVDCVTDVAPARYQPAPAYYASQPVARPAVRRVASVSDDDVVESRSTRSWQKRALVIGGSSGAGAGIGALIGGKKGALIGAAIGGGAGTVYEVTR